MPESGPVAVDLFALAAEAAANGPQWGYESADLDLTLLSWSSGREVAAHVNREVDVLLLAVAGEGEAVVDGVSYGLRPGQALVIPKGSERAIRCAGERFTYLSVHRRRAGLWPTIRRADTGSAGA